MIKQTYVNYDGCEAGFDMRGIGSSDSQPFHEEEILAIGVARPYGS